MIEFVVLGDPIQAGSKKIVTARGGARAGRPIIIDDASNRSRGWKKTLRAAAEEVMTGRDLLEGPLELVLVFMLRRPQNHYRTGRFSGQLAPHAPERPIVKPDVLKLARLVEDVLTGIVYRDDSQIVHEIISKRYADHHAGVQVFIAPFAADGVSRQLSTEEVT